MTPPNLPLFPSDSQADTLADYREELRVLVVGDGAREHALCWKLRQSKAVKELYAWPGNPGIARHARLLTLSTRGAEAYRQLAYWASENKIDVAVIGSEQMLCEGVVDYFERLDLRAFGPDSSCVRLEASKVWAKIVMDEARIPMSRGESFADSRHAKRYLAKLPGPPWVVKADGLAQGKGVAICGTIEEAHDVIDANLKGKLHGQASNVILVEEYLRGEEITVHAITDGESLFFLPPAQDHKRLNNGDAGPNTAGMGACAPVRHADAETLAQIRSRIFEPLLAKLRSRMMIYKGVLGANIMLTPNGPKVIDFKCRLGDPEAQVLLPLMENDFAQLVLAAVEGRLGGWKPKFSPKFCACVVMTSEGYPDDSATPVGREIKGLRPDMSQGRDQVVFHAATATRGQRLVTNGGRVLSLVATGNTLQDAIDDAYALTKKISFQGAKWREDIGQRALRLNVTQTRG